jgi:hypothetical protein
MADRDDVAISVFVEAKTSVSWFNSSHQSRKSAAPATTNHCPAGAPEHKQESDVQEEIQIVDVIHNYSQYSKVPHIFLVISRAPNFVYEKVGKNLIAHDSGFYDYMFIEQPWGRFEAFAGRKFDIQLTDGTTMHCSGQVWSGRKVEPPESMIQIGCACLNDLERCYVFSSVEISKAKYDAWMASNKPSFDYYKYDPKSTLEYLADIYQKYPGSDRQVSTKRARKLRQRGITIRKNAATGKLGWSPSYERRKAEIEINNSPDYKGRFHPDFSSTGAA